MGVTTNRPVQAWVFGDQTPEDCPQCVQQDMEVPNGVADGGLVNTDVDDDVDTIDCLRNPVPSALISPPDVDVVRYALAVGPRGCPHLTWAADYQIHLTRWDAQAWTTEVVLADAGWTHALHVDERGASTIFAQRKDEPGLVELRRAAGAWVEVGETGDRWIWAVHIHSRDVVTAITATQQYTGSDLSANVISRRSSGWAWSRVNDFDITSLAAPFLAIDTAGLATVAFIENKGWGPNNAQTNLWVADSSDLESWPASRVQLGAFNDISRVQTYELAGEVHMLALGRNWPERDPYRMLHAWRTDDGDWAFDPMQDCVFDDCRVGASMASRDAIHLIRGFGNDDDGYSLEHGVWRVGAAQWRFEPLGSSDVMPSAMALDGAGRIHLGFVQTVAPQERALSYQMYEP